MTLYLSFAAKTRYTDSMGRDNWSENPCKPRSHGRLIVGVQCKNRTSTALQLGVWCNISTSNSAIYSVKHKMCHYASMKIFYHSHAIMLAHYVLWPCVSVCPSVCHKPVRTACSAPPEFPAEIKGGTRKLTTVCNIIISSSASEIEVVNTVLQHIVQHH